MDHRVVYNLRYITNSLSCLFTYAKTQELECSLVPDSNKASILIYHRLGFLRQHSGVLGWVVPLTNQVVELFHLTLPHFMTLSKTPVHKEAAIQWVAFFTQNFVLWTHQDGDTA